MSPGNVIINEPRGYKVFPSAHSLKQNSIGHTTIHKAEGETKNSEPSLQLVSIKGKKVLDDIDSIIDNSMSHLQDLRASRKDIRAACSASSRAETFSEPEIAKSWKDAIVDCRIELGEDSSVERSNESVASTSNAENTRDVATEVIDDSPIVYQRETTDNEETTYRPSSSGIHSSQRSVSQEQWIEGMVSPTRCISQLSNSLFSKSRSPSITSEQWKTQSIVVLTDKAIAHEFRKSANLDTREPAFERYIEGFNDEDEFRGITNEPAKLAMSSKGEWNPRDIKMCSPFKACRGEFSKVAKSGEAPWSYDFMKTQDSTKPSIEGAFLVTAQSHSKEDVESFEHLYKAEFDLLEERNEHVDSQEVDEWRYQAGLTAAQMKKNRITFNRVLGLKCKYFGKRIYPYRGEFEGMASKYLHVLDNNKGTSNSTTADVNLEKEETEKVKRRNTTDGEHNTEDGLSDSGTQDSADGDSTPSLMHHVFDIQTGKRNIRQHHPNALASNVKVLTDTDVDIKMTTLPSIGIREAIPDFHLISPHDEEFRSPHTNDQKVSTVEDDLDALEAQTVSQGSFIVKIMLRFPYLNVQHLDLAPY